MRQRAGIIVPLFSLRGQEGIGTFGDLPEFAAFAHELGFSMLGLLPLSRLFGEETSPYGADSAFALDPMYIELAKVPELAQVVLERELDAELNQAWRAAKASPFVLYPEVRRYKARALELAFAQFEAQSTSSARVAAFEAFRTRKPWLREVALFSALRDAHEGRGWTQWPHELRARQPEALARAEAEHARAIRYHAWLQFVCFEQWRTVREALAHRGMSLFGDVPFGVGTESADVWANQHFFLRDADLGVPPDPFSDTGQNWRLPPFDIEQLRAANFEFLRQRLRATRELYDEFRLDHIVGYFRQWLWRGEPLEGHFTPAEEAQQRALGEELCALFRQEIDGVAAEDRSWQGESAIVAEDLGVIPEFVRDTLRDLRMAGYRVIPWERDHHGLRDPRTFPPCSVATYSTHDTSPIGRWLHEMSESERDELFRMASIDAHLDDHATRARKLFELLFAAGSARAFVLATELVDDETRINLPASVGPHNWTWRMAKDVSALRGDERLALRFHDVREAIARSGRSPGGST